MAGRTLRIVDAFGHRRDDFMRMAVELGSGLGGTALSERRTIVVPDYSFYPQRTPPAVRGAVTGEGVVSVVAAPMLHDTEMVGVLYVSSRKARTFDAEEVSLVTALAGQASIAIHNSRLLAALAAQNALLEQSEAFHERLTSVSLSGAGLQSIAQVLADLLNRSIVLEQRVSQPPREMFVPGQFLTEPLTATELDPDTADEETIRVTAGSLELGSLTVDAQLPLTLVERRGLEHGATAIAAELLKIQAGQEIEWRLGGELLGALLHSQEPAGKHVLDRASQLGIDLRSPNRVALIESGDGLPIDLAALRAAVSLYVLRSGWPRTTSIPVTGGQIHQAVLALPDRGLGAAEELLGVVVEPLRGEKHSAVAVGLSRPLFDLRVAYAEALACARHARQSGRRTVLAADEFGPMRFVIGTHDTSPLELYVQEELGPLLDQQGKYATEFLDTLRAYFVSGGHHPSIAMMCHIHKNTVKYRLGRIQTLLGISFADPAQRFEVQLALSLLDVLRAMGKPSGR
jgi:DNA-binding PucR family transcriptional regulator